MVDIHNIDRIAACFLLCFTSFFFLPSLVTTPPSRIYPYLYIYGLTGIEALFLFRNICLQEKLKFRAGEAWYGFGRELLYTDNLNNGRECLGFIAIDPNAPCTTTFAHPYRSTVSCEKQRSRHPRDLDDLIWRRPPPFSIPNHVFIPPPAK